MSQPPNPGAQGVPVEGSAPLGSEYTQIEGRVFVALLLGFLSLVGLVFPPAFLIGVAGFLLSLVARSRIAQSGGRLRGRGVLVAAMILSVAGCLLSLVLPGFVVYVYIYAVFHGGQMPSGTP